ncbi:MAG: signal peptidase I [Oscillospiraceae bacterium]|nr:signal peptidase I [Oscillospiraceae bacterium]
MIKNSKEFYKNQKPYAEILLNLIIIALLIVFVINIVSYFTISDRKNLTFLGYKPVIVKSGSMEPEIFENALVLLKKCDLKEIKVDDIASFFYENNIVLHKVIEIKDDSIRTKGVNNPVPDPFVVTKDMIFGKAIAYTNLTSTLSNLNMKTRVLGVILILSIIVFIKLLKKFFAINFTK